MYAAIQPGVHGVNRGSPEPARPHPGGVQRSAISERDTYLTEQVILFFFFFFSFWKTEVLYLFLLMEGIGLMCGIFLGI